MNYDQFRELVPENAVSQFDAIWQQTAGNDQKLSVCLAGAFSTGKTSLLNYLLGENILPVALEESTTLPTFIEYGEKIGFKLLTGDIPQEIAVAGLGAVIANPPEGAKLLEARFPYPWLQGVCILDLPGTGSVSSLRYRYAAENMRLADAVIYLLGSRGPGKADLEDLRRLHLLRKKVFIGVSHWDEVEKAVSLGEKMPDLGQWSREIEYNCGLKVPLIPVDNKGTGAEAVLDFLTETRKNQEQLRLARFGAEAGPVLENLLASARQSLEVLGAESEVAAAAAHTRLLDAKKALQAIRADAVAAQKAETEAILEKWDSYAAIQQERLEDILGGEAAKVDNPEKLNTFLQDGRTQVSRLQDEAAVFASQLSEKYGRINFDLPKFAGTELQIAKPPAVAVNDFLDMGRYTLLEDRLKELTAAAEKVCASDGEEAARREAVSRLMDEVNQLEAERSRINSLPVPTYEEVVDGGSGGRVLGRAVGELADIALFFVNPAFVAGKVGSIAGKAGKAIGMSAKAARTAAKAVKAVTKTAVAANKIGTGATPVGGLAAKAELLDMLTLGYWGEKLGSAFDKGPEVRRRIDTEALEAHQKANEELRAQIHQKRLTLLELERQQADCENNAVLQKEMSRIKSQMEAMMARAEQARQYAEGEAAEEFERRLNYQKNTATHDLRKFLRIQLQGMRNLLSAMLRNWWEVSLAETLQEKQAEVDKLLMDMQQLPERKKAQEAAIREQMAKLEQAARLLP